MQRARVITVILAFVACATSGCAPRPVLRGPEVIEADGGEPTTPVVVPAGSPDLRPPLDAAPLPVPVPPRPPAPERLDAAAPPPDTALPPDAAPPPPKVALLVVGTTAPLPPDDTKLKTRLEGKGLMVKVTGDSQPATQAMGVDLVVISGTSVGNMVTGKYQAVTIPVLCLEPAIMGAMKMTGNGATGSGVATTNQIAIALPAHPIAAGQTGTVAITTAATTEISWGAPAATADHIASLVGMAGRSTAYAYDKGQMMVGTPAPARRVGLFIHTKVADRLTPAGWQMFDAAVDWALGAPAP
jgi:hypothetical protein